MVANATCPTPSTARPASAAAPAPLRLGIERYLGSFQALDVMLRGQVSAFEPEIREMAAYCLDTSGKRLRPLLVFASGWSGPEVQPDLVRLAAVIEMVHLATLVHDDIMDRADQRRSRPTAARKWGPAAAVLLGDTLFAQSVHLSTQFPTTEVCREVSAAARRVCSGEIVQTLHRGERNQSLDLYWRVIELKTAELFRVACRLGASVGGHGDEFAAAAEEFGRRLGIAFQIFDDLADYLGDAAAIGKTLGTDLATGKLTLPLQLLRERAPEAELAPLLDPTAASRPDRLDRVRDLMLEHDVDGGTVAAIEGHLAAGEACLLAHVNAAPVKPMLELATHLRSLVDALRR